MPEKSLSIRTDLYLNVLKVLGARTNALAPRSRDYFLRIEQSNNQHKLMPIRTNTLLSASAEMAVRSCPIEATVASEFGWIL